MLSQHRLSLSNRLIDLSAPPTTIVGRTRRLTLHLGLLVTVLAAFTAIGPSVYSAPLAPSLPTGNYVALGDSYASGVGAPPYAEGTDVEGGNRCKRAAAAYAHQVADRTGKTLDFGACSGSWTKHFYKARTPWKEPAQLDHLSASTGLVTFSIGGNDAGFATIFSKCVTAAPFSNCSSNKEITDQVDSTIDALAGKGKQDGVYSYDTVMSDIATRAPNATVVAVGYPRMFAPQGAGQILPVPGRCEGVTKVDQRWINARTNELNAAAGAAAQRHGYQFADTSGAFTLTRDGDQLSLDASASTDADGAVANIDWYVQHANGTEEILTGAQATATVPAGEQVSVTAVVTDNQGKEDFTTQVSAAG